ncbi:MULTISPECIES: holin [unclassified Microbacterium]|uniref:holin n=1 Tax=unclassified Microbacterium TaxID=2609290 RepID=UPI00300F8081
MSKYANKAFWVDTFDRAVSTVAQSAVAVLTANVTGLLDVDWTQMASVAGLAGLVSVLTSVAFRGKGEETPTP